MSAMSSPSRNLRGARPEAAPSVLPRLELVPTPAPARGFFGTVATCVALFVGAFGAVFFLNNQMVATAWEIQQTQKALNVASAREATLEDQVVYASTPEGLLEKAEELGLTPATTVLHVDLKTGKIISPEQTGD